MDEVWNEGFREELDLGVSHQFYGDIFSLQPRSARSSSSAISGAHGTPLISIASEMFLMDKVSASQNSLVLNLI